MNRLKMAVVGCGDIAGYTALVSRLVPRVKLWACCDVDAARAQRFAARHRIPQVYSDYAELLAKAGADCVYLAVPHYLHCEMILAAAEAGLPALVEKPLTRTLAEGQSLLPKIAGLKVGVNYQYRYDPGCYSLARAVQAGALGRVHSVRINVPWHRDERYFSASPWHRTIAQAGGGTLLTQGSHLLDIALWAVGEPPISAVGFTASPVIDVEVDTLTHGIVQTRGGTLISITSSMVASSEQALRLEVYGEKGTAVYTNLPRPAVRFHGVRVRKENPPEWGLHALQRSLAGYSRWILDDRPFLIPAESCLPVLAAVDGIYRSAQSGRREEIEEGT